MFELITIEFFKNGTKIWEWVLKKWRRVLKSPKIWGCASQQRGTAENELTALPPINADSPVLILSDSMANGVQNRDFDDVVENVIMRKFPGHEADEIKDYAKCQIKRRNPCKGHFQGIPLVIYLYINYLF